MARVVEVLDPTVPTAGMGRGLARRVDTVDGKTVGLRVLWPRFEDFVDRFEELLDDRYRPKGVIKMHENLVDSRGKGPSPRAQEFFEQADWAVLGLAA